MPFKKSAGNMYDWVTHTHSHLGGECPHKCIYCYVKRNRFGVAPRYQGEVRLIEKEFDVNYGSGNTIFIEHMNDMFADTVRHELRGRIIEHCMKYPNNKYVFQTKNPLRAFRAVFPKNYMIGTTIESNRYYPEISKAPEPESRIEGIEMFRQFKDTFITIEPILNFDVDIFSEMIIFAHPTFINIGADSKNCNLPEPTTEKIKKLIDILQKANVSIRKKNNLQRFL